VIRPGRYVTGEDSPSGTFFRAAEREANTLVLGPSAPTTEAALTELDRDAGGPQVRAREPIPGEPTFRPRTPARLPALVAIALLTGGCASLQSFADKAETVRRESAALMLAVQETLDACEELQEPKPRVCTEADRLSEALEPYAPFVGESP
jgi:hypothetical protein